MRKFTWWPLLNLILVGLCLTACGNTLQVLRPVVLPRQTGDIPAFKHIFVVVMENLTYDQAVKVPELASLSQTYATATNYYGVAHPSLPNYLALTSGGTHGVTDDCWFCYQGGDNLGWELTAAKISWGAYMEGLPSACWMGPWWPLGDYAGKHDPFRYYLDIRDDWNLCQNVRPLGDLTAVLGGPSAGVPRFVWVTPNLCHDGHDCPASQAAKWLDAFVGVVTASPAWHDNGVLFIVWDEGAGTDNAGIGPKGHLLDTGGGGHVLALVIAPKGVIPGKQVAVPYNHYSFLKTVEEALGLPLLGETANPGVTDLRAFWAK